MKWSFWFFIGLFFLLYGSINFYIGLRGWQNLFHFLPHLHPAVYWLIVIFIAAAVFLQRLAGRFLPDFLDGALTWIGSYWMGMMYYFLTLILAVDLLRLLFKFFHLLPAGSGDSLRLFLGLLVFGVVILIQVYGTWNALHPRIQHYEVTIDKQAGGGQASSMEKLHLVMVSDIHLDRIVGSKRLGQMVEMINAQDPDLVLFAGDVIDSSIEIFSRENIDSLFREISSRYGVFAVPGNHEYISGKLDDFISHMEQSGVKVLRDQRVTIADSFYLVGRDEQSEHYFKGGGRKPLAVLLEGIDTKLPVIVMDHEPTKLQEAVEAGADLQLSGHTHRGQLFPNNLITSRIFEDDWGYLKKGNLNLIVSSGFGTWGPPIRLGSQAEVVDIMITFQPADGKE